MLHLKTKTATRGISLRGFSKRPADRRPAAALNSGRPGGGVRTATNRRLQDRRWTRAAGGSDRDLRQVQRTGLTEM